MPNSAFLSFSAETGELSDNFDIISVETRNMYNPVGSNTGNRNSQQARGGRGRREKKSGGWGWFFTKIILLIIVAGGAYVGYTYYRMKQRNSRF
jgi:mannose-binding lectin 2